MFGAEFYAMKVGVKIFEGFWYNLRIIGVPIGGSANMYCKNEALYNNTVIPESFLR